MATSSPDPRVFMLEGEFIHKDGTVDMYRRGLLEWRKWPEPPKLTGNMTPYGVTFEDVTTRMKALEYAKQDYGLFQCGDAFPLEFKVMVTGRFVAYYTHLVISGEGYNLPVSFATQSTAKRVASTLGGELFVTSQLTPFAIEGYHMALGEFVW